MTVVLELKPETEKALQKKAKAKGFEIIPYLEKLIEKDIETESEMTFAEIFAPIQKGFEESGMSEDEILEMFEQAREEVWQEQQQSKKKWKD